MFIDHIYMKSFQNLGQLFTQARILICVRFTIKEIIFKN